jgi:hypothetical protein
VQRLVLRVLLDEPRKMVSGTLVTSRLNYISVLILVVDSILVVKEQRRRNMNEELCKAIDDYFDVGDFAEFIGIKTRDIIEMFPDEVDVALDDIKEMMQFKLPHLDPTEEDGDEE